MPSSFICRIRRSSTAFSILNSGMPYRSSPPGSSARSNTATVWPARVSCWAAASPAGPEPTTATVLPVCHSGGCGRHPALVPRLVDDGDLDVLDRHRVPVDPDHAGGLARRRAQPPGELREVVGRVQPLQRLVPVGPPDQVVPLRDQVAQRAPDVAERDAAVHAAPGLLGDDRQHRPARAYRGRPRSSRGPAPPPAAARRPCAGRRHEALGVSHAPAPRGLHHAVGSVSSSRPSDSACSRAASTRA